MCDPVPLTLVVLQPDAVAPSVVLVQQPGGTGSVRGKSRQSFLHFTQAQSIVLHPYPVDFFRDVSYVKPRAVSYQFVRVVESCKFCFRRLLEGFLPSSVAAKMVRSSSLVLTQTSGCTSKQLLKGASRRDDTDLRQVLNPNHEEIKPEYQKHDEQLTL